MNEKQRRKSASAWGKECGPAPLSGRDRFPVVSSLLLSSGNHRIDGTGHDGADHGCEPEKPELLQRPAADEECRAGAACGVHGEIGHGNTDQMDERESKP